MPFYEYKCKCGKTFEILHLPGKENGLVVCPECGATEVTRLVSKPYLPSSVGAPADLKNSPAAPTSCCGSNPKDTGCKPGSCCADAKEQAQPN